MTISRQMASPHESDGELVAARSTASLVILEVTRAGHYFHLNSTEGISMGLSPTDTRQKTAEFRGRKCVT